MPEATDIILRSVVVMAATLLAGLLLAVGQQRQAALPGGFFCLAVAAFFVTSIPGGSAVFGIWLYPLTALCVTKTVWFWLFARALFNNDAKLGPHHLALVAVVAGLGTWQQTVFLAQYRIGNASTLETFAGFGFEGILLLFVLAGLYEAWRDMSVDLVERRRRFRLGFIVATGVYLTVTLGVQTHNLLFDVATPVLATWGNMTAAATTAVMAAWFLVQPRRESWLDPSRTSLSVALNHVESVVLTDLRQALETDRIFLQEGLTIGALAERLGTREHVLRQVINRGMGHSNFNDFLHAWRIREACEELARPELARHSVLSIAMKVGYGSVGAFNRAFKARVGMTPTDYRRSEINTASHLP